MSWRPTQMPHQVTYDVVATSTFKMSLSRAKDREIRYGCQLMSWQSSQMPHQVTYDVVATPICPMNA
eukprot:scaffold12972_cov125-Skeletonema_marinoi.AAC.1